MNKPKLEQGSIKKTANATLTATLVSDFDRYSTGLIMMAATQATFKVPDSTEDGAVSVDLGGTVVEIKLGARRWSVQLSDVVSTVHDIDKEYVKNAGFDE